MRILCLLLLVLSTQASAGKLERFIAPEEAISCHWNFGDGDAYTGLNIAHFYAVDAEYIVTVTCQTKNGPFTEEFTVWAEK